MFENYSDEALIKALAKPNDLSGHTSPDGTPLTNYEYYENSKKFN